MNEVVNNDHADQRERITESMRVDLRTLQDNPTRNFKVDPIDSEVVTQLRHSIEEDGFWGGIVCRKIKGNIIQIAAGHHRVRAAILAGITFHDVTVNMNMDDDAMVRILARENATQRGNQGTARMGSVAAALKRIIVCEYHDCVGKPTQRPDNNIFKQGVGWRAIEAKLHGIPGISETSIQEDLAALKASGLYSDIISGAQIEIDAMVAEVMARAKQEEDNANAQEEAKSNQAAGERTRKIATKAAEIPRTFDVEGVSKYIKEPAHRETFRKFVEQKNVKDILPVDQQFEVAKQLVEQAKVEEAELNSTFIRTHLMNMVINAKREAEELSRKEEERLMRESWQMQIKVAIEHFGGACRRMQAEGIKIEKLLNKRPDNLEIPKRRNLREDLLGAKNIIDALLGQKDFHESEHSTRKSLVRP